MTLLNVPNLKITIQGEYKICDGKFEINRGDVILLTGPNGCGKSTVIKVLMGDTFDYRHLSYQGTRAFFYNEGEIVPLLDDEKKMDQFRRKVCYVSQNDEFESDSLLDCLLMSLNYVDVENKEKYIFDFVTHFNIQECFDVGKIKKHDMKRLAKRIGLNENELDDSTRRALKILTLRVSQLSGGQRKLANIISNLIKYNFCQLVFLDEPLNNLDYKNVRALPNILTRIHTEKPELGFLIVTHCRSLPVINKVYEIDPGGRKLREGERYICNSCFGKISEEGLYL